MDSRILFIHGLSPIHSGTGQAVDVIDLPIARERTTGWPYLPGSSIKGVLRDACRLAMLEDLTRTDEQVRHSDDESAEKVAKSSEEKLKRHKDYPFYKEAFGPEDNPEEHAGALAFGDARILCMPVRSFAGTFAWTTCPMVLKRVQRDDMNAGLGEMPELTETLSHEEGAVARDSVVVHRGKVYLEDLDVSIKTGADAADLADMLSAELFGESDWQQAFRERFVVVSDDLFSYLCETTTEITARVRLRRDTKTVATGALWYEEALPTESILYSPLIANPRPPVTPVELFNFISPKLDRPVQIGGNASVGRGLATFRLRGERS